MNEKKKSSWSRTLKNTGFMLGMIGKICPSVLALEFIYVTLSAISSFLVSSYVYMYALNAIEESKEVKRILVTIGCILVYAVFCEIINALNLANRVQKKPRVVAHIQNMLQTKAVEVDIACFENADFYDVYVKATRDASELAFNVLDNVVRIVFHVLYIGTVGALIATIEPIFILLAAIPLLYRFIAGSRHNQLRYEYNMKTEEAARKRDYVRRVFYLNDFSKEMRLTEIWRVMFRRMHDSVVEMKELVKKYGYTLMLFRYSFDFAFELVVYIGSITLAAYKTLVKKTMLVGDCVVVVNSILTVATRFGYMTDSILQLNNNSLYIENLRTFLDYEVHIKEDNTAPEAPSIRSLELCQVSFSYGNQGKPVLKNINMSIHAGEKIAIVGHNGAGKTTLIKLLQRLYDPTEGEIRLNGKDIRNYRLSTYRNLFGTVFQDYGLFAVSIAENVLLRGNITEKDREIVKSALIKSRIYEKVKNLPYGMDTIVTKEFDGDGAVFSGGEEQKISIARVLAGEHEIVIMDEPTSALDPIAEQEMYMNMFEACEGKTVIFISHRLSSATMADRIYMFENGEIIEQGTHRELLDYGGKYADMWHKQADTYTDAAVEVEK